MATAHVHVTMTSTTMERNSGLSGNDGCSGSHVHARGMYVPKKVIAAECVLGILDGRGVEKHPNSRLLLVLTRTIVFVLGGWFARDEPAEGSV